MKIVKRVGVFETNSSSTHSFMIVDTTKKSKDKPCAFQLMSPLAKLVWFLGLVDNALNYENFMTDEERQEELQLMESVISKNLKSYNLPSKVDKQDFIKEKAYDMVVGSKNLVLDFKELLLKEFCNIECISESEAQDEFINEACRILPLENIYLNPKAIEQFIDSRISFDEDLKTALSRFSDKQLAFREYMSICYHKSKEKFKRFKCDFYFENGCLNNCDCNYQNFMEIRKSLEKAKKDSSWRDFAKWFLSSNCKILGLEKYCGVYDIVTTDQY